MGPRKWNCTEAAVIRIQISHSSCGLNGNYSCYTMMDHAVCVPVKTRSVYSNIITKEIPVAHMECYKIILFNMKYKTLKKMELNNNIWNYKGINCMPDVLFWCLFSKMRSIICQPYPNNGPKKMELHWRNCDQNRNQSFIIWTRWKIQLHNDGLHHVHT